MLAAAALRDFAGYAAANRIQLGPHARNRMDERGATYRDVRFALMNARMCSLQQNGRWFIASVDEEGDGLNLICGLEDGVFVVTLMDD